MADGLGFSKPHLIYPLAQFGLGEEAGAFYSVDVEVIWHTWVTLAIIAALCIIGRIALRYSQRPAQYLALYFVRQLSDTFEQALGGFYPNHLYFGATLFIFIFLCNVVSIVPRIEEPTRELNTTLALSIIAFIYTQVYAIKEQGVKGYLQEFISPFFLMLPLNIIGKLASIISLAFRLFGNIFASSIITTLYFSMLAYSPIAQIAGLASGLNLIILLFFGVFEGFIQAFIFTILAVTNLGLAIAPETPDKAETT